ncbi:MULTISPECIES: HAD family hydrolase [unclassified Campylobacter]|uniref:HAD family hydrolase n=1 Tax=unclassified Campylobacter TaxID=2593542 RepID=UPI003D3331BD
MRVAIFDMDGTLIDSSVAIEKTVNDIRAELSLEPLSTQFIITAINEPGRNLAYDLYGINNPDARLRDSFEEKFKQNYAKFACTYDKVDWLLDECRAMRYAVTLASNAPLYTLEAILKKCEIFEKFDYIIGANDEIPQKPDPKMLDLVCDKFDAKKAVFIGDSLKDELAANNAKMPYIQVSWGFGEVSKSAKFNAKSVQEALMMIKGLLDD